jgi:hypothetical protein
MDELFGVAQFTGIEDVGKAALTEKSGAHQIENA